ncbi:hypothetical protein NOVOSPHI9U_260254 [Novosphingobium sp. 9U]|nr:hypothetical protein NOVOSPHI9U_260254 [Novosphingobium sp. 9U]
MPLDPADRRRYLETCPRLSIGVQSAREARHTYYKRNHATAAYYPRAYDAARDARLRVEWEQSCT